MSRRIGIVALVVAALVAVAAAQAEAHYHFVSGKWIYIKHSPSIVLCESNLGGVANPTTNPAKVECEVTVTLLDALCRNHGGNLAPGQIPREVVVIGQAQITPGDITNKKKGLATVNIEVLQGCAVNPAPDDPCLLGVTAAEACPNENWELIDVIVRAGATVQKSLKCTDDTCTTLILAGELRQDCVLPPEVDFETVTDGTPYTCTLISNVH